MKNHMNMNNTAMNAAIETILNNIGNNPEAMAALVAALSETQKIANEPKTEAVKKSCKYVICLERYTVDGDKVYHPVVMTPPTCEDPVMLIIDNAVAAQDKAQSFGMMIRDNVYAMPATDKQIEKLYRLLKECNKRIVDAIDTAMEAVGMITANINRDALCAQYMQQMMQNCHCIIGSSLTENSEIIEEDIEVVHRNREFDHDLNGDYEDSWNDGECDDDCDCECCPNHPNNR